MLHYHGNDDAYSPFVYNDQSPYYIPAYNGPPPQPDTHPHYDLGAYETTPYEYGNDNANSGNGRLDGRLVDQGPNDHVEDPAYHVQHDDALVRRAADFGVTPQELLEADAHCIREQNEWLATTYRADRGDREGSETRGEQWIEQESVEREEIEEIEGIEGRSSGYPGYETQVGTAPLTYEQDVYDAYNAYAPIATSLTYDGTYAEHDNEVETRGIAYVEHPVVEHHVDGQTSLELEPGPFEIHGISTNGFSQKPRRYWASRFYGFPNYMAQPTRADIGIEWARSR
jgi:hypothetical protein